MRHVLVRPVMASLCAVLMLTSGIADAQWALVARRAIGRVEQMSQTQPGPNGVTYDTAAVILDAPADKVYATAARAIRAAQGVTVTREDDARRSIEFTDGQRIAGMQVSPLGDDVAHLMISSAASGSMPAATAQLLERVLRVCREMNVECQRAQQ